MASFRIILMPRGSAPEEVRREWVGVILPLKGFFKPGEGEHERDLLSFKKQTERSFVTVPVETALTKLKEKSPKAAQWFYDNLPLFWLDRDFSFGIDEVEIIDSL